MVPTTKGQDRTSHMRVLGSG